MATLRNGVYIVQGEMSLVVSALRRNARWGSRSHQDEEQDPLLHGFSQLKEQLSTVDDLSEVDVNTFLGPFLDVIRSEDTTGPITGVALTSVNKFLSYGLIDPTSESAASGIENLADAVTHARFVGTDPSSDEVVLMKILQVLRTLLLTPVGAHMTNESVCEIMQSCFRICFETRLSELLRRSAEQTLMDMVQLLFSRLPQFKDDFKPGQMTNIRKVFKRAGAIASGKRKKHFSPKPKRSHLESPSQTAQESQDPPEHTPIGQPTESQSEQTQGESTTEPEETSSRRSSTATDDTKPERGTLSDADAANDQGGPSVASQIMQDGGSITVEGMAISEEDRDGRADVVDDKDEEESNASTVITDHMEEDVSTDLASLDEGDDNVEEVQAEGTAAPDDYVNPRGVRFTPQQPAKEGTGPLVPYGLPCIRELFRFLISLINPQDRHNSEAMIHMGLSLLTVALESGAHHLGTFTSLINLVKDELCKNLFLLIQCDFLGLFAMALRVCFLLFEALRVHLKLQFEMFFKKLMEILTMDMQGVHYEKRELVLDAINQLFRVPNLVTELYLNYDCDLYSANVFEELCKLLSKNAFPAGSLFSVHLLALDALLGVVQSVEGHCHAALVSSVEKALEDSMPVEKEKKKKTKEKTGDDDSGTDEHCETPTHPPSPPTSGYAMAQRMTVGVKGEESDETPQETEEKSLDHRDEKCVDLAGERFHSLSVGRLFSSCLPTPETLAMLKQRKKLLQAGSEHFNNKPKKGIEFLQEHGLLHTPLDPEEMARLLRENPRLDKKTIGEYIGKKDNSKVLDAFVRSFEFHDLRVDEGLRQFLESFRLPGESPVIEHIMEFFSEVFFECNPEVYANKDAVFTLAYAVIMLNVDQHNANIKQQKPMVLEDFKRNLRKINGGNDFPATMLEEIFTCIKNEEIVMPAERTGRIRDTYEWKVLLKRSLTPEGKYVSAVGSSFDQDLFCIIWGPTVAALSYVYDNGVEKSVVQKAITGFRKCSLISAHYSLSDVFDNLVISLCKFTTLLAPPEAGESLAVAFGSNLKAQQSARTLFALAHRHGDILREGWKNIMDCMLQLFKAKLLPKSMVEAEDFVSGRVSLLKEELPTARQDTSIFSWYQYLVNPEPANTRGQTPEDKEAQKQAQLMIRDLHPELLITESKFLRFESLNELIKVLTFTSNPDTYESVGAHCDEEAAGFCLELLIRVVLQNRDRVSLLWHTVRDHLSNIIINATHHSCLVERSVVGLLRLAIRLLRKEEISNEVLTTLRVLLMMKHSVLMACGRQISFGLHELLRTNAASITSTRDWVTVFTLLECVGAAATPPTVTPGPKPDKADSDSGISDGVSSCDSQIGLFTAIEAEPDISASAVGDAWLLISKEDSEGSPINQYDLTVSVQLNKHDSKCFVKSCQSLTFLIQDCAHVSKENFLHCVHAVRVYTEASLNGGTGFRQNEKNLKDLSADNKSGSWGRSSKKGVPAKSSKKSPTAITKRKAARSAGSSPATSEDELEIYETINNAYDAMALQLIELMYALHTCAASFYGRNDFKSDVDQAQPLAASQDETIDPTEASDPPSLSSLPDSEGSVQMEQLSETGAEMSFLWTKCWCPLLQGIARLCCDNRKEVRMSALTFLQRALLVQDMQVLSAVEWESCFNKVLFPMLSRLLEVPNPDDPIGLEETRMRAATLLSKVFLQHLSPLLSLSTFTALWLTILDFMDKYMHADKSDLLFEAIPESLKNMLLVMSTAGIFHQEDYMLSLGNRPVEPSGSARLVRSDSDVHRYSALWQVTWERIDCFLPNLKNELFSRSRPPSRASSPAAPQPEPTISQSEPTIRQSESAAKDTSPEAPAQPPTAADPVSRSTTPTRPTSPPPKSTSISSLPDSAPQVCVMLQPPLPSLSNKNPTPPQLGSLANNIRPSVPIILAPSPSLDRAVKKADSIEAPPSPSQSTLSSAEPSKAAEQEETSTREENSVDPQPEPQGDQTPGKDKEKPAKRPVYDI
ncbi:Golgi-specific brefeldin A-resistance guanine nucleotide exchange factor 1 isoform X2 [Nematostella vectensis]|uniref:Golgi-specific brefeldin A-resistance guanine nucleotide exchange factor 1 isoform X2 n=1 Tax=Nematostella vectensis TaxID=45351 RepID=UPI002077405B|nr:Golgi-specific brefeldin A-resistance guanine nucleotide exchange factor 1 isoform X2 [Nematostella vectensis]